MHYGQPGAQPPPYGSFTTGSQWTQDYRSAGHVETALPLPRRALTPWTIAIIGVGLVALVLPWGVLAVATSSSTRFTHLLREGGGVLLLVAFLHTILSVAMTVMGAFVVRGRAIPGAFLFGGALLPAMVGAGGALYQQNRMVQAIANVSPAYSVRIGAQGFSEIDSLIAFASLASGALALLAAVVLVGGVLSVDARKLEDDARRAAGASAPASNASWLVGTASAAILAVLALGSHLIVGWSWQGSLSPKLAIFVFVAAAAAAGPVLRVVRAASASAASGATGVAASGASSPSPLAALAKAEDVRRVAGGVILGALSVLAAIYLFDRAAAAFVSRGLLAAFASGSAGAAVREALLPVLAIGVRASSRNQVVDVVLGVFLFAPALLVALRRRPWAPMLAGLGLGLVFVLFSGGFALARSARLAALAASADRMTALLPDDPCFVAPPPLAGSYDRPSDLHRVVTASGELRALEAPDPYGGEAFGILPARGAPVTAVVEAASPASKRSSSETTTARIDRRHVKLLGAERPAAVPPGLEAYRSFILPGFQAHDVDVSIVDKIPSTMLVEASTPPGGRTGGTAGAWSPTAPKRRPAPFFVFAKTPSDVTLTCATNDLVLVRNVSLADMPAAERAMHALRTDCVVSHYLVVPAEGAKAADLYALLTLFRSETSRSAGTSLPQIRPIVTLDRATASSWMAQNPEGPRSSPPIPSSLGFAGDFDPKAWSTTNPWAKTNPSATNTATVRQGATTVRGGLAPEVVQRTVRTSFSRLRYCYENALVSNPRLAGTISVRLAIDPQGKAVAAADAGTDITDKVMVACVVRTFSSIVFPAPTGGGLVEVHYPVVFSNAAP